MNRMVGVAKDGGRCVWPAMIMLWAGLAACSAEDEPAAFDSRGDANRAIPFVSAPDMGTGMPALPMPGANPMDGVSAPAPTAPPPSAPVGMGGAGAGAEAPADPMAALPPVDQVTPPAVGEEPPVEEPQTQPAPVADGDPVPSAGCGKGDSPGAGNFTIDVAGTQRSYIVAVPSGYDASRPYRLVFAWHYLGGNAAGIARSGYYGLESRSAGSAIFVSAEGISSGWSNTGGRDVAFASEMLGWLKRNYCVDESRVFSTGFSYGAIMSNTVGCALGDQFRAIAPMSGSGPAAFGGARCSGQVAAWISHGSSDTVVSFAGGQGSRDHWLGANHCAATTTTRGSCVVYDGCDDGYPVHWCEVAGGQHVQPRFGPDAIWEFFSGF